MKPNHLFTGMLALATIVATSCSAPRMAQQSNNDDDVYNSTAQAKVYTQAPVKAPQYTEQADDQYDENDYYGTSDPYYDMDYSSRINRFHYSSPWRSYYDPYFDNGWSLGIGFSPFYNSYWNSPYSGWGYAYSPFWGYNNWGWNNYYYGGGYYGGGYYGGGFLGGGYYGGGYYTGRTTNTPDYRPRPARGSRDGYNNSRTSINDGYLSPRSNARSRGTATNGSGTNGTMSRPTRGNTNSGSNSRPAQTESSRPTRDTRPTREATRPTRESYTPPPSYNPPARSNSGSGSSGGGSSSSGGGGSTGNGRPTRGGR